MDGVGERKGTLERITDQEETFGGEYVSYFDFSDGIAGIYMCENDQTIYYKYVQFIL